MKLSRKQWEFLELINRTPEDNPLGWKIMSPPIAQLFHSLSLPRDIVMWTRKQQSHADGNTTIEAVCLLPFGKLLLKYGTCPK